jgi:hypothetical protein
MFPDRSTVANVLYLFIPRPNEFETEFEATFMDRTFRVCILATVVNMFWEPNELLAQIFAGQKKPGASIRVTFITWTLAVWAIIFWAEIAFDAHRFPKRRYGDEVPIPIGNENDVTNKFVDVVFVVCNEFDDVAFPETVTVAGDASVPRPTLFEKYCNSIDDKFKDCEITFTVWMLLATSTFPLTARAGPGVAVPTPTPLSMVKTFRVCEILDVTVMTFWPVAAFDTQTFPST